MRNIYLSTLFNSKNTEGCWLPPPFTICLVCDLVQGLNYLISISSSGKLHSLNDIIVLFYVGFQHQLVVIRNISV